MNIIFNQPIPHPSVILKNQDGAQNQKGKLYSRGIKIKQSLPVFKLPTNCNLNVTQKIENYFLKPYQSNSLPIFQTALDILNFKILQC